MAIRYRCPECRQLLSIGTRMGGQATSCPMCGAVHDVPLLDQPPVFAPDEGSGSREESAAENAFEVHAPRLPALAQSPAAAPPVMAGPSFPSPLTSDPLVERAHLWAGADEEEDEGPGMKRVERQSDELDLIPMVDCVFLLLVFYMITASYALQKTIEMAAPAPDKKGAMQAVQSADDLAQSSIIVQIDARNRILIDDVPLANRSDLANALRAKMQGDQKNELVVEADPRAFEETVVAVADAAHELQFQRVRMGILSGEAE